MCTVSVVPATGQYIFTFNRDEKPERHTPHFIKQKQLAHKEIYFAQDSKAGGSWFVADNLGNILMLFNGAFTKHHKKEHYSNSRGIILLQMAAAVNMQLYFKTSLLTGVEPFSIILFEHKNLYRLTWDGVMKHTTKLLNHTPYIFSSATLYNEDVQQQRRQWLSACLKDVEVIHSKTVFNFHAGYNLADKENGLIIERPQSCHTLSISQAVVSSVVVELTHTDLKTGQVHHQSVLLKT